MLCNVLEPRSEISSIPPARPCPIDNVVVARRHLNSRLRKAGVDDDHSARRLRWLRQVGGQVQPVNQLHHIAVFQCRIDGLLRFASDVFDSKHKVLLPAFILRGQRHIKAGGDESRHAAPIQPDFNILESSAVSDRLCKRWRRYFDGGNQHHIIRRAGVYCVQNAHYRPLGDRPNLLRIALLRGPSPMMSATNTSISCRPSPLVGRSTTCPARSADSIRLTVTVVVLPPSPPVRPDRKSVV